MAKIQHTPAENVEQTNRTSIIFSGADAENMYGEDQCRVNFKDLQVQSLDIKIEEMEATLRAAGISAYIAEEAVEKMISFIEHALLSQAIAARIVK